jgi:4'-phosphopantetheinyl transferase
MPVRFQRNCYSGAVLLVWESVEEENELLSLLPSSILTDGEYQEIKSSQKKRELLTSRVAILHLSETLGVSFDGIKKDEHGKPYLVNSSWHMSVTHSSRFIGVIMHPLKPVGIDVELPQKKMWRILPRLFNEQEIRDIGEDLNRMSIYWSAKEALYKLYGKRSTDFRTNLLIHQKEEKLIGEIVMPDHHRLHQIEYEQIDDYFLVWTV